MQATYPATGKGQLRHYFHGTYSAGIALMFADAREAQCALPLLGDGWTRSERSDNALVWFGGKDALTACEERLAAFGADRRAIASIAKSIDYGEPFTVRVPVPIVGCAELPGIDTDESEDDSSAFADEAP